METVEALEAFTVTSPYGQFHGDPDSPKEESRFPKVPVDALDELFRAKKAKPTTDKPQLDHDGDGKAGGSKPKAKRAAKPAKAEKPASPLAAARKAYHAMFGKNPGPRWSVEQIEAKMAEADLAQVLGEDGEPLEIPEGDLAHDLANPSSIGVGADDAPPTSE
ncbi:hypothetical protein SZ64_04415 [Erythrobacter sp. SG61-1L]|nr:hypothetical protein SZ64_04415 [Erythrobacter sp. SG61-1L]